jgi:hypothetical protein
MYTLYCVNSLDESLVFPHVDVVRSIEAANMVAVKYSIEFECPIYVDNHDGTKGYTVTVTKSNKD